MKRIHALLIVIAVAVAATAGMFAAMRTASLGASSTVRVSGAQIAHQNRALDRAEASLRAQARQHPPALPTVPSASAPAPAARRAQVVIYRRPPAIVHVTHRAGEHEHESEGADHGEGLDD